MACTLVLAAALALGLSPPDRMAAVVSLEVSSAHDFQQVRPGQLITWTITAACGGRFSLGLAGFTVDVVQAPTNPICFDIPPGGRAPAGLEGFDRPAGICNPGTGGAASGFGGTPMGTSCSMNLRQVGGMQNNTGVAGTVIGQDIQLEQGIGRGASPDTVAIGVFAAPSADGEYSLSLTNGLATIFEVVRPAPEVSFVSTATVTLSGEVRFWVTCPADYTQDGNVDQDDVQYLVNVVAGGSSTGGVDPDFNQDGNVDQEDVYALIGFIAGSPCP